MLDSESKCRRERLDSSEVIEELDPFLRKAVDFVISPTLLNHAQGSQLLKVFDQSIVREVCSI